MVYIKALLRTAVISVIAGIIWYYKANIYLFTGIFSIYVFLQAVALGKLRKKLDNVMGYLR